MENKDDSKELVKLLCESLELCANKLDKECGFTGEANRARLLLDSIKDSNNGK